MSDEQDGMDLEPSERGTAEARREVAPEGDRDWAGIAAVLWVPDVEQRYGWREYYVRRPSSKPGRRMGFGR